jgi:hypothetical protein
MAEIRFNKTVPEGNRAINRIQWQFGQATPIEGLKYGIPSAIPRKINKTDTRAIEIGEKARSRNRIAGERARCDTDSPKSMGIVPSPNQIIYRAPARIPPEAEAAAHAT